MSDPSAKSVLLTGAWGFIGRNVIEPLKNRGFAIHACSREALPPEPGIVSHQVDLLDLDATSTLIHALRPTHLLHLAWRSRTDGGSGIYDAPENADWARASVAIFHAFARARGRRAVFAGSCVEYECGDEKLNEIATPSRATSAYGRAKNEAREAIQRSEFAAELPTAWARLFFTYGPYEPQGRLVSDVARGLIAGQRIKTTSGHQVRDYLYVADVADALAALVDRDVTGTINVGSGVGVQVRQVVETLGICSGRADLLEIGARAISPDEPACIVADVRRLRAELKFAPRYSLEDGLKDTLAWWRGRANP